MKLPFMIGLSPILNIRALIATENIEENAIIERCPAVIYPIKEREAISKTIFDNYYFEWDETHDAIALGYGSLVNHSYTPNTKVIFDYEKKEILMIAMKKIIAGEEIMINYNDDSSEPVDPSYITFDERLKNG